ncbi:MAG: SRPBCC family protein [Verrucomicrobia bacterium]|nr:SRPBCC family protein [Verrucomicrobiota bacterium]
MRTWKLHAELWVPQPLEEVFAFFSDAGNLERLTPPWLNFEILTPQPIDLRAGTLIDYRIRLRGLPIRWRTEISEWNPPVQFVDRQLRGPYTLWQHTHRFEARDGGTMCFDDVEYRPFGGALIQHLFVRRDVERIFEYRKERLREIFRARSAVSTS